MYINVFNKIKKCFKGILFLVGFKLDRNFKLIPLYKKNVFNKKFKKRVLISYVTDPFFKKNNFSHTNFLECYSAAEVFSELGFVVDVVDFQSNKKIIYEKYDVVYGMGEALGNSFYFKDQKLKRIFYATGCNPIYSNLYTLKKIRDFYNKHNTFLIKSSRFIEKSSEPQILLSDGVVVLGNEFVLNTYLDYDAERLDRYKNLNAFYYDVSDFCLDDKNFSEAKKHFLWFGSSGFIHKGLDLLIDLFSKREDIYLHICGFSSNEKEFFDYYDKILTKSKNIINYGFVDIKSNDFKNVMKICAFTIYPSVSEGGAPSVLNVIANGGLIPILSRSSGINIEKFGFYIEELNIESIKDVIVQAMSLKEKEVAQLSLLAKKQIRDNYSYKNYKDNLKNLINSFINN